MKTVIRNSLLLLMLVTCLFAACEWDDVQPIVTEEYDLRDFTEIALGSAFQVEIVRADRFKVTAEGRRDDLFDLDLRVIDGRLTGQYLPPQNTDGSNYGRTHIYIEMPRLTAARLEGATRSRIFGFRDEVQTIRLEMDGNAELNGNFYYKRLYLNMNGNSKATFFGRAQEIYAGVSGKSHLQAFNFPVDAMQAEVSGLSEAVVYTRGSLQGSVHGSSQLTYYGNPQQVSVEVSGNSKLIRR